MMNELTPTTVVISNIIIISWVFHMTGYEMAKHNLPKLILGHWRIQRFVSYIGLWYSWSMFAPTPLHSNRNVYARIVDPNGKELAIWTEPDWTLMNRGPRGKNPITWFLGAVKGKWDLFYWMRLRKLFSTCGEGRQWDMPLLLRQMCRQAERHCQSQGINGHSVALFMDIDYAPYFDPKHGIMDWKTNKDSTDHLVYVYECENTHPDHMTYAKEGTEPLNIPYEVRWSWNRDGRVGGFGQEQYWVKDYLDEKGQPLPEWAQAAAEGRESHPENPDNQFSTSQAVLHAEKGQVVAKASGDKVTVNNNYVPRDNQWETDTKIPDQSVGVAPIKSKMDVPSDIGVGHDNENEQEEYVIKTHFENPDPNNGGMGL